MTEVVIDIESTGRTHKSVFAIALCVKHQHKDNYDTRVFYIPDQTDKRSKSTLLWWNSDPDRKKFLEDSLDMCSKANKESVIRDLRAYIDEIYNTSENVIFYSDFPTFDVGMTNAILAEYDLLPLYLKDDNSYPSSVVNYVNYLRGYVKCDVNFGSSKTFAQAGIERPVRNDNHDPIEDVRVIMKEIQLVKNKIYSL